MPSERKPGSLIGSRTAVLFLGPLFWAETSTLEILPPLLSFSKCSLSALHVPGTRPSGDPGNMARGPEPPAKRQGIGSLLLHHQWPAATLSQSHLTRTPTPKMAGNRLTLLTSHDCFKIYKQQFYCLNRKCLLKKKKEKRKEGRGGGRKQSKQKTRKESFPPAKLIHFHIK